MAFETREEKKLSAIAPALLRWYGRNARQLPWRIGPKAGAAPDPYHVWLSEIMLQQTTVATVVTRYGEFLERWPNVNAMAAASLDDILGAWAGLGYYARARNLHKCASVVVGEYGGVFPDTEEELKTLPGIGDYTAAAIAAIAFSQRAVVVDGNIERVVSRIFAIETQLPAAKPIIKQYADQIWPKTRSGDFAQGLMDLGAGICRPKAPSCGSCPISSHCDGYARGCAERFPVKAQKKPKPTRSGAVFALRNSKGEMLFERRPEKGLLGGMLGLPGTDWLNVKEERGVITDGAPANVNWNKVGGVTHIFTHFHLQLEAFVGVAPKGFRRAKNQQWIAPATARLPTVMKKAVDLVTEKQGE